MEFDIIDLIKYYFKNIIIVGVMLLASLITGMFYVGNIYKAEYVGKTTIMLGINELSENKDLNIYFNSEIVKNYIALMKSDRVLKKAIKLSNVNYKLEDLKRMINIYNEGNTQYITIEVVSENITDCQKLSYNIYKALMIESERIFNVNNIHLIDSKKEGTLIHNRFYYIVIFIFVGLILSIFFITAKFLFFKDFIFMPYFKNKYETIKPKAVKKVNNTKKYINKNNKVKRKRRK